MVRYIQETDKPFGIAVQAFVFRRLEYYSNIMTKKVFEELEYGNLTSDDLIHLGKSLEEEDKTYFHAVCYHYYLALHNINAELVNMCADKIWREGRDKAVHLCKDEIDTLAKSREATVKALLHNNDEAVWERILMDVEGDRFMAYINKIERDGGRGNHSSCVYDFLFGANEGTVECLESHTQEIVKKMNLIKSSV